MYKKDGDKVVEKISIPADNILQVAALLQKAYAEALDAKKAERGS